MKRLKRARAGVYARPDFNTIGPDGWTGAHRWLRRALTLYMETPEVVKPTGRTTVFNLPEDAVTSVRERPHHMHYGAVWMSTALLRQAWLDTIGTSEPAMGAGESHFFNTVTGNAASDRALSYHPMQGPLAALKKDGDLISDGKGKLMLSADACIRLKMPEAFAIHSARRMKYENNPNRKINAKHIQWDAALADLGDYPVFDISMLWVAANMNGLQIERSDKRLSGHIFSWLKTGKIERITTQLFRTTRSKALSPLGTYDAARPERPYPEDWLALFMVEHGEKQRDDDRTYFSSHDCVNFGREHFSDTFTLASADVIRRLGPHVYPGKAKQIENAYFTKVGANMYQLAPRIMKALDPSASNTFDFDARKKLLKTFIASSSPAHPFWFTTDDVKAVLGDGVVDVSMEVVSDLLTTMIEIGQVKPLGLLAPRGFKFDNSLTAGSKAQAGDTLRLAIAGDTSDDTETVRWIVANRKMNRDDSATTLRKIMHFRLTELAHKYEKVPALWDEETYDLLRIENDEYAGLPIRPKVPWDDLVQGMHENTRRVFAMIHDEAPEKEEANDA